MAESLLSFTSFHVGPITRNVMNIAKPMRIWLGGNCCVPIAWRNSDSTITMRVKLVIMIRIAGASDKTVRRMINCNPAEKFSRLVMSGILNVGVWFGVCA